ncbi:hypothetical protein C6A85_97760, partial [Mycobacterium sp. ITM-2017-0098]
WDSTESATGQDQNPTNTALSTSDITGIADVAEAPLGQTDARDLSTGVVASNTVTATDDPMAADESASSSPSASPAVAGNPSPGDASGGGADEAR